MTGDKDWDRHLTAAGIAINSSRHASTGYTPFFLNHNQEVRLPYGIALKEAVQHGEECRLRRRSWGRCRPTMGRPERRMAQAQAQQERAANRHRREETYVVGEQVMLQHQAPGRL